MSTAFLIAACVLIPVLIVLRTFASRTPRLRPLRLAVLAVGLGSVAGHAWDWKAFLLTALAVGCGWAEK